MLRSSNQDGAQHLDPKVIGIESGMHGGGGRGTRYNACYVSSDFFSAAEALLSKTSFEHGADKINTFWEEQSSMSAH